MINCSVCECKHNNHNICNLKDIIVGKNAHDPCRCEDTECNSFSAE